jgi:hypothetical protein
VFGNADGFAADDDEFAVVFLGDFDGAGRAEKLREVDLAAAGILVRRADRREVAPVPTDDLPTLTEQ